MAFARIIGTGGYLRKRASINAGFEPMVDTTHEWIRARAGISRRHIAADGETTCDLAKRAARSSIDAAGVEYADIDLIVVATTTADQVLPSTACLLRQRLGIRGCPAFDVQAVCSGSVYALDIVDKFIRTHSAQCAMVVGAETFSRIINWEDRGACVLFGDGAGAMVIQTAEQPGIRSAHLHADGAYKDLLSVPTVSTSHQRDCVFADAG